MKMAQPPTQARHIIVNFITGNTNKLSEVKAILENDLEPAAAIRVRVESQALDLVEIQGTLEEVTIDKCRRAADLVSFFLFFFSFFSLLALWTLLLSLPLTWLTFP